MLGNYKNLSMGIEFNLGMSNIHTNESEYTRYSELINNLTELHFHVVNSKNGLPSWTTQKGDMAKTDTYMTGDYSRLSGKSYTPLMNNKMLMKNKKGLYQIDLDLSNIKLQGSQDFYDI